MASNVLELPHICRVRNSDEFFGLMYICRCGTTMRLRPNKRLTDGWWWKCPVREFQKSKSVRTGTFFFENKLNLL